MSQLLISVTNIKEAGIALANGADIIDLKDPHSGALGALPLERIVEITHFVNQLKPVSATIGDLPMQAGLIVAAVDKLMVAGVDYIKIGFFENTHYQDCLKALKPLIDKGARLIAVLFAEKNYPDHIVSDLKQAGFTGIMLDTAEKNGLTLLDYYTVEERISFCQSVLKEELALGLAGSLNIHHIPFIKVLQPSYIGFRGGVCDEDQRTLTLDAKKIKALCKIL